MALIQISKIIANNFDPLFKQLPKVERPFYSQAKALTFFLNDIADEITAPDANTARSADELGRFVFL